MIRYVSSEDFNGRVFMTVLERRWRWWPWSTVVREYYSAEDRRAYWYHAENGEPANRQSELTGIYTAGVLQLNRLDAALADRPQLHAIPGGKR